MSIVTFTFQSCYWGIGEGDKEIYINTGGIETPFGTHKISLYVDD